MNVGHDYSLCTWGFVCNLFKFDHNDDPQNRGNEN